MKIALLFGLKLSIILALSSRCSNAQNENTFKVDSIYVSIKSNQKSISDFMKADSNFYEDEKYIFSKSCSGEWGGTLKVKDKLTGNEYECSATCPVIINKLNGKYIVTTTMAHMSGFSEIMEIEDPTKLKKAIKKIMPKKARVIFVGEAESKSKQGTKTLVDTMGILTLVSFPYQGKLYHITTDFEKTYLSEITNNKFNSIQIISNNAFWNYNQLPFKTTDGHLILFHKNNDLSGYIDIYENEIKVYHYKNYP